MSVYPENVVSLIREPAFCVGVEEPCAAAAEAKFDCGCFLRFEMRIDDDPPVVREIGYRTNGCGFMAAAAELLSASLAGRGLTELHGVPEITLDASAEGSECASTAVRAVKSAFAEYRNRKIEEFAGEQALICTCFGVLEETIEEFVRSESPTSVEQVTDKLRAGGGCGSCCMLIREIIDSAG